ncbi:MAG: hypothetical protein L6R41_002372 [Letrouitia leprolyta]|nr:MAG: hypothetical protein L6R41_002372 [Letrouitia leprolyta]
MTLHRPTSSFPASTHQIFKFAAASVTRTASLRNPQNFHSSTHFRPTSRRKLVTTTTYRPHSFDSIPPPAPPRNTGIPDSSIAGLKPEVHDIRPPSFPGQSILPQSNRQDENANISIPEAEAQKSKPVVETQASNPAPAPAPRKSRLRARKAAMTVTPAATRQLRKLLSQPEPKLIRVGVRNRGCSGLAYHLEYVDKPGNFDDSVEQDGIKVLIDSKALFSIIGSEMDWVEDKLNERKTNLKQLLAMIPSPLDINNIPLSTLLPYTIFLQG